MKSKYTPVKGKHQWTKDEIKMLTKVWDSMSLDQLAKEFNLEKTQVSYMANEIRKLFPKLCLKKHRKGEVMALIKEALG